MDTHKNASLTPKGREAMARSVIEGGLSKAAAARQFNTTPKTVAKWVERFRAEGVAGLRDRSSRPHSSPSQTTPAVCAAVEALRRQRHTGAQIAAEVGVSAATVSRILQTAGPQPPVGARAGRAGPSLRTGSSRRDHPHRHQKAGQVQPDRPSGHGGSHRSEQHPWGGAISNRRVFATVPAELGIPDGAAIDTEGGYWSALHGGGKLRRFHPDGSVDRDIDLPVSQPTMPAFAGDDLATLYVTSASDHMSEETRAREPNAGELLRLNVGSRGVARSFLVR